MPRDASGHFVVKQVAEWLWDRFVADGLKNFGDLERAHVYALLASDRDIVALADENNLSRVITTEDLVSDPELISLAASLATTTISLDSNDEIVRRTASQRIGQAINFIVSSPFIFAPGREVNDGSQRVSQSQYRHRSPVLGSPIS